MEFAVHTVLLLTILYTNLTRAQNLDSNQIAPIIPSSSESNYGSENEVISSKFQNGSQPYISGQEIPPDGKMCSNVSMWSDVYWTTENVTICACEIETKMNSTMNEVCMNITSMNCTLELSLNCSKTMKNESTIESIWHYGSMEPWHCIEGRNPVWHNKTAVECRKIPTYYCDSIWEIQADGTKVWAGNNQCDYYEWEDCRLVTKPLKFYEPIVSCKQEGEIPFRRLDNDTKITNLVTEICEMVNCVQCLPVTENICKEIEVVKTYQEIIEKCTMVVNMVPRQDFEHIEKCFFNHNPTTGGCDPATTCSGQGTCKTDGSCECNAGFTGTNCSTPTPERSEEPIDCFVCEESEPAGLLTLCKPSEEGSSASSEDYPYNYCMKALVGNYTIRGIGIQQFDPASIGITNDTCKDNFSSNIQTQFGTDTVFDRICVCFSDNCNEGEI